MRKYLNYFSKEKFCNVIYIATAQVALSKVFFLYLDVIFVHKQILLSSAKHWQVS